MKKTKAGELVYSPSDLIRFLASPYATWMDRYHLEHPGQFTPDEPTEEEALVAETGNRHEAAYLAQLEQQGGVVTVKRDAGAEAATMAAIAAGENCIFQACLRLDPFQGFADFLKRTGTDANGRAQYAVWDTKLALKAKPYYLIQLCCYAEMLAPKQGSLPAVIGVVLGKGKEQAFNTAEFFHYYRQVKAGFLKLMAEFDPKTPPVPRPRADHGRWGSHAERWLEEQDHLVQVAGINVSQMRKLEAAGIKTMAALAKVGEVSVPKLNHEILERLQEQAKLQVETRELRAQAPADAVVPATYRILPPPPDNPRHGLTLLPPPNDADVFFDMEGYPLIADGLEYLFGASTRGQAGRLEFHDWWAHDRASEKQAFEGFMDWVHARWRENPDMHIYHYAHYEVAAVRRLASQHGTRENEADDLQRNGVFVDLYKIVKQGLRIGEPSYSIKYVEHLYRGQRSGDVATAGASMVYFANWMESGEPPDWRQSPILKKIRDYNQDDCESTVQLCDWLRVRQQEANLPYLPPPPKPEAEAKPKTDKAMEREAQAEDRVRLVLTLRERMAAGTDPGQMLIDQLFLDLLEFHRREEKPIWWRLFSRMEDEVEDLKEDLDCIGGAELEPGDPVVEKRSLVFTYRFDPDQDTKISAGDRVYVRPSMMATFGVQDLDPSGLIRLKISAAKLDKAFPDGITQATSFLPVETVNAGPIKQAIQTLVTGWVDRGQIPPALMRLLQRQAPLLPEGVGLQAEDESPLDAAVRVVQAMKESVLCLQGPPGTGKTHAAARMIAALVNRGKKVGVMSNSHKAIENLLLAVDDVPGLTGAIYKVGGNAEFAQERDRIVAIPDTGRARDQYQGGVIGGTAWLFSRPEWEGQLDYLFVDEAGQVSLANLVGVAVATANLILMGDQMQLEQPTQGAHPHDSGESALGYYLHGHATIPLTLGIFLGQTFRLEPEVCRFVSDVIYEGRLQPAAGADRRRLVPRSESVPYLPKESGLVFFPVEHEGNVQASAEEAEVVRLLIQDLVGRTRMGDGGLALGEIGLDDIMVVAPYNLQVRRLRETLPAGIRVGSVDKFQGQEAEIIIVSMCSSFGEYGSRGLEFLLDPNRLNVAITRSRTLAVVVGDPRIAGTAANSISAMRRLNLYCRLVQEHSLGVAIPSCPVG